MPDKRGLLSDEEIAKIGKWLNEKTSENLVCPSCKHKEWSIVGHVVIPLIYGDGAYIGPQAYPQIMVACTNCGHTMFFNAVKLGIAPWEGAKQ
jgi:DNA-directed RNA polymerase subunit RPC12/RpoP